MANDASQYYFPQSKAKAEWLQAAIKAKKFRDEVKARANKFKAENKPIETMVKQTDETSTEQIEEVASATKGVKPKKKSSKSYKLKIFGADDEK